MKRPLDRNSFVPLYAQIHEHLLKSITAGELAPGAPVPSERELSEWYGVSRMTARQALRALRRDGLVYGERGLGTFVARRKVELHTRELVGFTQDMCRRGLAPSTRVVLLRREKATRSVAAELGLAPGETVFHLERLRLADGAPMAYERNYIAAALCPDLDEHDLEKESLYGIMEENGLSLYSADEVLEAAAATPHQARHLGVRAKAPILVVRRVVYSATNQAIESARTLYRGDRYRATFHLTKNDLK